MPISQARILRHWAHDTLQTPETWKTTVHSSLHKNQMYPLTLQLQLFYFRWQHERTNKQDGSHEPQVDTTTGASSCSHLSLQSKQSWSSLEFKASWKIPWGSSPQNPWVAHTATLKTGGTEASAQKTTLPGKLWDKLCWGMLYSRKAPTENPVPTPLMNLDKSHPLCSHHNRSSLNWKCGATLSSSAASLIPGALPSHREDRRTQDPPWHLWGHCGRGSESLTGDSGADSKVKGGVCGGRDLVSWALPILSLQSQFHFYLYHMLGSIQGVIWTKILKDQKKKVWKALG